MTFLTARPAGPVLAAACLSLAALPLPGRAQPWSFVYMGDHRGNTADPGVNTSVVAVLAADIAAQNPDLVLVGGDLINGAGGNVASLVAQYDRFKAAAAPITDAGIPMYPVAGNHEFWGATNEVQSSYQICTTAWYQAFGQYLPPNGPENEGGLTYAFTHENALFLGLNVYTSIAYKGIATDWVSGQLAASTSRHVFAFSHLPMSYVSNPALFANRDEFWSLLGRTGARLFFGGHVHHAERTITATPDESRHYIYDILNGAGGAPLDGTGTPTWPVPNGIALTNVFYDHAHYGYTLVTVDGDAVDVAFRYYEDGLAGPVWRTADAFGYGRLDYANTIAEVTRSITNAMAGQAIMGLVIALVDGSNTVWQQGFGYADYAQGLPVATDTVFRIGSVSKTFTAAALMQLRDQGRVGLEDSLTNLIPEFAMLPRFTNANPITVRSLLNHQAGIPGDIFNGLFTFHHQTPPAVWSAWLTDYLRGDYPAMPPDLINAYGNSGWVLAGDLVGRLTGTNLETYAESSLFSPLGMTRTSYLPDKPGILEKWSRSYAGGLLIPDEYVSGPATGGMLSCAPDMAKFLAMLLANGAAPGGRILSTNALAEMMTPQGTNLPLNVNPSSAGGLGWDIVAEASLSHAGRAPWKDGATIYQCAFLGYLPDQKLGVFVAQNSPGSQCDAIGKLALKLAALDKVGLAASTHVYAPPFSPVTSRPQAELDALAGVYGAGGGRGYSRVAAEPGSLTLTVQAHTEAPVVATNLVPRENGWFSRPDSQATQFAFTNLAGRFMMLARTIEDNADYTQLLGERFTPPALSPAWTGRLDRTYVVADMQPDDLYQDGGDLTLTLRDHGGVLLLMTLFGAFALEPVGDAVAFTRGLPMRRPAAIQAVTTNGLDLIRYGGFLYRDAAGIPALAVGAATPGATTLTNEIAWFRFAAVPGARYAIRAAPSVASFRTRLYTAAFGLVASSTSNALDWTCASNGTYYLSLSAACPQSFTVRVARLPAHGVNDFDGNGASDLAVYDPSAGRWYARAADGSVILWAEPWGGPGLAPVPGDFDADAVTDLGVYAEDAGRWYVRRADGTLLFWDTPWGGAGLAPAAGDFDGDGRQDLAVYAQASGAWYILGANGALLAWDVPFGGPGLSPVGGDYDGDGASDLAVYDSASGNWYVRSAAGSAILWAAPWGGPGLAPVPGDYDGDGASDLAVYDQAAGNWYVRSAAGDVILWATPWGGPGLVPVPGDYDGDGASDLAVYDQAAGNWYARSAAGGVILWAIPWGGPGLAPLVYPRTDGP